MPTIVHLHIQISPDQLCRSHCDVVPLWLLQVGVPLRILWGYSDASVTGATAYALAAEYPHNTPTVPSKVLQLAEAYHSGTV